MANITDAFGTITVKKVGKEFLEFLNKVQGEDSQAYYTLVDREDIKGAVRDKNNNLKFDFSTFGRWSYFSNLEGYLKGDWMNESNNDKKAYDKFIKAMIENNGLVKVEYTDSDSAMDWMGKGEFTMSVKNGKIQFTDNFNEQRVSIIGYAELYGYSEIEALDMLYGDEVSEAYQKYVEEWKKNHTGPEFNGIEPAGPSEWYDNEYSEVEEGN